MRIRILTANRGTQPAVCLSPDRRITPCPILQDPHRGILYAGFTATMVPTAESNAQGSCMTFTTMECNTQAPMAESGFCEDELRRCYTTSLGHHHSPTLILSARGDCRGSCVSGHVTQTSQGSFLTCQPPHAASDNLDSLSHKASYPRQSEAKQ